MAFLSTNSHGRGIERFELNADVITIGRHPECDIVVDAGAVSRYHAKVFRRNADFAVEDAGSRNGTYLNGQLLTSRQTLQEGDRVRISDVELVFHMEETPEFARPGSEMTFDGSSFGIVMVDDQDTKSVGSKVEFQASESGLKISATAEAKLAALTKINRNLTGALALDDVLPKILESLFEIFPAADRGFVVMENPEGVLVPRWVKLRYQRDETETVRISRTIIRNAMRSGEAVLSFDAMDDSRFNSSESIADFSIRSLICAPLHNEEGSPTGALQIDSTRGRGQFREDDVDLLAGVAAQASALINNARLHERALRQREVEQDLKLATEVQQAFLPQRPPDAEGFRVRSFYRAANHIGGDYFDYIPLPDGRVAILVADVVGHGVAAAMYMAKLSAEARFCLASERDWGRAVEQLNDRMSRLHVERFVTLLLMVIDSSEETVAVVNAGHMAPIVRRQADGTLDEPGSDCSGLPIAIDEGMRYESVTFPFLPGDVALLFTDGLNEAMNAADEEFGIERIRELVAAGGDAEEIHERIVRAVFAHVGPAPQVDDMCLVVIERLPSAGHKGDGDGDRATPPDTGEAVS